MFHRFRTLLVICAVSFLAACGGNDDAVELRTLLETAKANPDLSILVEAVTAAGLEDALSGDDQLTVFAPTNAAFEKLLKDLEVSKEDLLADTELLTAVLTYHAVAGKVLKADVPLGKAITTLQGGIFKIDSLSSGLNIKDGRNRDSKITKTDVLAINGAIHIIDTVILPANKNIVETAVGLAPEFSILVEAVTAAGLGDALSGTGPLTVFAPTNAAFAALLTELGLTKEQLLASPLLGDVLKYHVVAGRVLKADVPVGSPITTLQGATFTVDGTLAITDQRVPQLNPKSKIIGTDVFASNGVIHVIDKVILPVDLNN